MILLIGAVLGIISVAFGAYSEHALRENVSAEEFRFLMTAIRYNQVNAVIICSIGMALFGQNRISSISQFRWSGFLFILGTILFSFSIYLSVSFNIPSLVYVTPFGGIILMISWLLLAVSALKFLKNQKTD